MRSLWHWLRYMAWFGAGAGLLLALSLVLSWHSFPRQVNVKAPFSDQPINIRVHDWYDLGTVDLNRDGMLDIFTTNHSNLQSLIVAGKDGEFEDCLARYGLSQDSEFPGLEDRGIVPDTSRPGLYIYYLHSELRISLVGSDIKQKMAGLIKIPAMNITIVGERELDANLSTSLEKGGPQMTIVAFGGKKAGMLRIAVPKSSPMQVHLDSGVQLDQVFVGFNAVNPHDHVFEIYLKDRHGIAWSDFNSDGMLDAFIVRGGLHGQIADFSADLGNQFFISSSPGRYIERITEKGFSKMKCPGRQVAWVDVDGDHRLDLYIACGRKVGGFWEYIPKQIRRRDRAKENAPNLLYLQTPEGKFRESAHRLGLDFDVGGTFLWFDVDNDGDADLLWASEKEVTLYRNTNSNFEAETVLPDSTTTQPKKLVAADFDSDGDIDVYVVATLGSQMLINENGKLRPYPPKKFGLPAHGRTASWVDYDNDGRLDLYVWPGGLYRQIDTAQFQQTGILRMPSPFWPLLDARALWFDYDNDGDRDVIIMQRWFPRFIQEAFPELFPFTAVFLRNDSRSGNHWCQFELEGPSGNPEAIGAAMVVNTIYGRQRQEVGQFESSHYSQGHYRLYFGRGSENGPIQAEVFWPPNQYQIIDLPNDGSLYRIKHPDLN